MRPGIHNYIVILLLDIEKYDERNARQHIRRVKEILSNPPVLTSTTE